MRFFKWLKQWSITFREDWTARLLVWVIHFLFSSEELFKNLARTVWRLWRSGCYPLCAWGAVANGCVSGWWDVSYAEFQNLDMRGNDCTKTSSVEFHILGQKCPTCRRQETKLTSPQVQTEKAETLLRISKSERIKIQTGSKKATVCEATCGSRVGRVFVDELFFSIAIIRLKCLVFRCFNVYIYIYIYIDTFLSCHIFAYGICFCEFQWISPASLQVVQYKASLIRRSRWVTFVSVSPQCNITKSQTHNLTLQCDNFLSLW